MEVLLPITAPSSIRKWWACEPSKSGQEFEGIKAVFRNEVASAVALEAIPSEFVLNWDQTGIMIP